MEMLQQCQHPNIVQFLGCFINRLDLWICMDFCGGGGLDSMYRAMKKPFTEDQIACMLYDSIAVSIFQYAFLTKRQISNLFYYV